MRIKFFQTYSRDIRYFCEKS